MDECTCKHIQSEHRDIVIDESSRYVPPGQIYVLVGAGPCTRAGCGCDRFASLVLFERVAFGQS